MSRTIKKVIVWTVALVVGLPVLLYLILVAINWPDREPSPLAIKMTEEYRANSNGAVDDNGYIDLMGFAVAPGEDPHEMGLKRIEWISRVNKLGKSQAGSDPQGRAYDFKSKRDAKVQTISNACNRDSHQRFVGLECLNAMEDTETLTRWIESESWLLERYQRLLARSEWVDEAPVYAEVGSEFPPYAVVMDGQKLLLAKVMVLAKENQISEMQKLLASDARFWRRVMSSTNILIGKMVAIAALDRHFTMANIALRSLSPDAQQKAIPDEWQRPIADEEKSLHKVMIGEWIFAASIMKNIHGDDWDTLIDPPSVDHAPRRHWYSLLGRPFYKQQATLNNFADIYSRIGAAGDVEYQSLPKSIARCDEELRSQFAGTFSIHSAYNPIGQIVVAMSQSLFSNYIRRVADIEGVRRATLGAVELREALVKRDQAEVALSSSSQRNPYTKEPFAWDAKEKLIVFKGLEKGERGEHHIFY